MKSFKELIRELDNTDDLISIQEAVSLIRAPFFIVTKNTIKKEVLTDDKSKQKEILSDYFNVSGTWIIPSRESQDLNLGDSITKKELRKRNAIPLKYFTEEDEFTINEGMAVKKIRIINGKRVVQWRCPKGEHKTHPGGKVCTRTTGQAAYKKKRAAIKSARKRRQGGKKAAMNRSRARSMRKRRGMGL